MAEAIENPCGQEYKFNVAAEAALVYIAPLMKKTGDLNLRRAKMALEMGIGINDFYDLARLSPNYKQTRRQIGKDAAMREAYRDYYADIRDLERHRPTLIPGAEAPTAEMVMRYRERVNAVSLGMCVAASGEAKYGDVVQQQEINPDADKYVRCLHWTVMAMQVTDDLVGRDGDIRNNRPSFWTAYAWNGSNKTEIREALDTKAQEYLSKAWQAGGWPMGLVMGAAAVGVRWYPTLVETAEKVGWGKIITTERDYNKG